MERKIEVVASAVGRFIHRGGEKTLPEGTMVTWEESRALIDQTTQERFGFGYDELIERFHNGTLPDDPIIPHLLLRSGQEYTEESNPDGTRSLRPVTEPKPVV